MVSAVLISNREIEMSITTTQIEALMTEAGEHGDLQQVEICERALTGDEAAIAECQRVIDAAAAQQ